MSGRVIVAGAGCGDYDLITMRGYEALKSCDVVIYDSLIAVSYTHLTLPTTRRV